jgi:septation ring formation regulator EzrA
MLLSMRIFYKFSDYFTNDQTFRKARDQLEDINTLIREKSMGSSLDNLQKDIQELVRRIADLNNHIKKTNDDFEDVSR